MSPASGTLYHAVAQVPDHRKARGRSYPLPALLTFAASAMLCGATSLYAIAQWGRDYNHLTPALGFSRRRGDGYRTPCVREWHTVGGPRRPGEVLAAGGEEGRPRYPAARRRLGQERNAVEHGIGKQKAWRIAGERWRNLHRRHTLVMKNVAGLHIRMFAE